MVGSLLERFKLSQYNTALGQLFSITCEFSDLHLHRNFIADASKAEFSREDGNPLYLPDHTPVKLPTHITDGNLDIKIPQYSSSLKHKVGLRSPVVAPTSDTLVDVPRDQSGSSATQQQNGTGPQEELHNQYNVLPRMEWDHNATQNGIGPQETGTKPHTAVMIEGTNDSLTSCGMETSEHENGTRV